MNFSMRENSFITELDFGTLEVSGNEQYGFRPYQLLVSSIAVCSGGVLRKVLDKMRISYDDMKITADVKRNEQGVNEVTDIALHFSLFGVDASEEKIKKALHVTWKNCPIVQSVKDSIRITETFELK
ncbi:OsmC family protein [Halalkalibacterium halodurans]|uniref:BH0885 protein n=2 Tax=Halalkalibacterium halodurans TaxID=86665 RepID=Q9KEG7_HALH5|nr:OsmC family protein [Halalkalibacterium halodurans]MDY7221383.1 OsmC family protein [Halalkalibacterium halodurans]MDY7240622.1 OsmC family protein [Halalkalibacterium halodurans]MED3646386.1 OsmC family protein [Halalkalibacterium halodurans]MED4080752.1 OsmC family protein [Halalkalibacterium halodurans]MED4086209.1 OsmC family protein [Halalkalibacterium halodurans]